MEYTKEQVDAILEKERKLSTEHLAVLQANIDKFKFCSNGSNIDELFVNIPQSALDIYDKVCFK